MATTLLLGFLSLLVENRNIARFSFTNVNLLENHCSFCDMIDFIWLKYSCYFINVMNRACKLQAAQGKLSSQVNSEALVGFQIPQSLNARFLLGILIHVIFFHALIHIVLI